jgi:hypothetical protein
MAGASITSPNTTLQTNGNGMVSYTGPKAGIKKVLSNLILNVPVRVKINLVYSSKPMYIAVAEGSAQSPSVYSNLLYSTMSNGSINFTFTPTQPSVELSMRLFYISTPFAPLPYMSFTLDSVSYTQQTGTSSNTQLVQISNKLKGGYRFGYNGQEKVDEIAGAGNHTTAEFWEYDTRLGRRWNRDPVVKPWESSYACFANNPIWYSDVNGDDGTKTGSGNGYMTGDLNNVVVRSSKLDPDKKEDDGEKSSGGGGGGARTGGGGNSKNSVGGDQLKKYSPLLQAQGFGIADNGGGSGGGLCPNCLDQSTIGHNLLGLSYPGGNNPLTRSKDYTYSYVPTNLSEYPAIGHDRRYDKLKIKGASGLFTDTRAIGADWRFVAEEFSLAINPTLKSSDRISAGVLGMGLGLAAMPKTLLKFWSPTGYYEIKMWYKISNKGVNNTPTIHKH